MRFKKFDFLHIPIAFILLLSLYIYFGGLRETVHSYAFVIGNYNRPFLEKNEIDYKLFVDYTAKGAFIAGEPIHADIRLELLNGNLKNKKFVIVFPGAYSYTLITNNLININNSLSPSLVLKKTSNSTFEGSIDLVYYFPKDYEIRIIIDNKPQIPIETNFYPLLYLEDSTWQLFFEKSNSNCLIDSKSKLHIAPLEERNQIKNNEIILILTIWAIVIAILQIILD